MKLTGTGFVGIVGFPTSRIAAVRATVATVVVRLLLERHLGKAAQLAAVQLVDP